MIRRILVPVDFSECSTNALTMAIELAVRFGAGLTLLHAQPLPTYTFPDGVMPLNPTVLREMERSVQEELERLAGRAHLHQVPVRTQAGIGPPSDEIVRYAAEMRADLIVMGTHGRTGLRRALLGSVAEKVVRHAPCPVLTVGPECQQESLHP
jgi:nucleotide-binding universal stress UspA family protein